MNCDVNLGLRKKKKKRGKCEFGNCEVPSSLLRYILISLFLLQPFQFLFKRRRFHKVRRVFFGMYSLLPRVHQ